MIDPDMLLSEFAEQGYIVIDDILDLNQDIQPVIDDYEVLLDNLAEAWYRQGKLKSAYSELSFELRYVKVITEISQSNPKWMNYFDIALDASGVTKQTPIHLSKAVFGLICNPKLLDIVEVFIGSEIYSNPIQHARIKPPQRMLPDGQDIGLVGQELWHQDRGVGTDELDNTDLLTVWIPMVDATVENGCLVVVPGSHRDGLTPHCPGPALKGGGRPVRIPNELLGSVRKPVPVKRGGIYIQHGWLKHGSLPNVSEQIRWSFDLRYQPIGQPTGRPEFPGFVLRSQEHPELVLNDYKKWRTLWEDARSELATDGGPLLTRWDSDTPPGC